MSRILILASTLIFGWVLQGCRSTYIPAPNEEMTTIRTVGFGKHLICKDGKFYGAPEAKDIPNGISVPTGQRLTVGSNVLFSAFKVTYVCRPFVSFVPKSGQTYVMYSELESEGRCIVELVREDPASKTGLAIEPSVGKAESECSTN